MRALVMAAAFVALGSPAPAQTPAAALRPLVIPFEHASRDPQSHWLSEAVAVILTDDLVALGAPAITRDDRLRAVERLRVPPVAALSHATVIRLGQLVGAGEVILGSIEVSDQWIEIRARQLRIESGRLLPDIVERVPRADLFGALGRIARRIGPASTVTPEQMERSHPPLAAMEQYVRGLIAQAPTAQIGFLTQALKLAPSFQRTRLELWRIHTDQDEHTQALAAVRDVPSDHRLARQARFLAALSMLQLGQAQEAFDTLTALNTAAPDSALFNNLGVVQLRRGAKAAGGSPIWFFSEAARLDAADPDLFFNLGYAYWFERDAQAAMYWLREAVRRNPADHAAHYVLGVALQAAGNAAEAAREKELATRLSSDYEELEARQPNAVPRGLERLKTDLDMPSALRVENVLVQAEQRDLRELAAFHLEAGTRAYEAGRDADAIGELRRAVYLSPYHAEAHLLLGRAYLRSGRVADAVDAFKIAVWSEDSPAARAALAEAESKVAK